MPDINSAKTELVELALTMIDEMSAGNNEAVITRLTETRVAASENGAVSPEQPSYEDIEIINEVIENPESGLKDFAQYAAKRKQAEAEEPIIVKYRGTYYASNSSCKTIDVNAINESFGDDELINSPEVDFEAKKILDEDINRFNTGSTPKFDWDNMTEMIIQQTLEQEEKHNTAVTKAVANQTGSHATPNTPEMKKAKKKAVENKKTDWASDNIAYHQKSYTVGGETKEYKLAVQKVDWGTQMLEGKENNLRNIKLLEELITNSIYNTYGDWSRIKEICVVNDQLIINGICFFPALEMKYLDRFPLDSTDYIMNGCLAPFFNWWYLKKMHNLTYISFDSANFFVQDVADKLCVSREIGERTLFKACRGLQVIEVEGATITRYTQNTVEGNEFKRTVAKANRFTGLMDGYKLNVCSGTQGLQDYTFTNLKSYAQNRGEKGLFRFCVGTLARAGLAGAAGVVNFGAHLLRGIKNVATEVIRSSVTPVNQEDIQS